MTWRDLDKSWHDVTVDYCDVCGNLLIRQYWEFQVEQAGKAVVLRCCREEDERLYVRLLHARGKGRAND